MFVAAHILKFMSIDQRTTILLLLPQQEVLPSNFELLAGLPVAKKVESCTLGPYFPM